jgi:hypothetical protein
MAEESYLDDLEVARRAAVSGGAAVDAVNSLWASRAKRGTAVDVALDFLSWSPGQLRFDGILAALRSASCTASLANCNGNLALQLCSKCYFFVDSGYASAL